MHVALDLNWFLQFVALALATTVGFLYLLRSTASRYFVVDSNFGSTTVDLSSDCNSSRVSMAPPVGGEDVSDACAVCGLTTTKQCARCKTVKYCSEACQRSHWTSEHKSKCKILQGLNKANNKKLAAVLKERIVTLVPDSGSSKILKQSNKILFPYEEFVRLFEWEKPDYPLPCGLLNCGNSCFANVVLQCLAYTRPLVAYLLEKGHKAECQMDNWCFFCEFQTHVERATGSASPFSPLTILSRLPNIGGNLGYGQQEDAHEFMRFAIDTMQSVCLAEFGGEKSVRPSCQQTTLIQHIFGGRLQSQVLCTQCNNVSNQFENMMDLTVEIHGDAETLEECLDQFTAKEQLHGDNMYKCDDCNAYVTAWKRLTVQQAPNILTIALKRFQSGRFGKLNKRVAFPEKLNLSSYMSDLEDGNDYILYAVVVHLDMLNASYFGHYICYVKDFGGNWYRIDDYKVARVELDEVLSQGAYMLLYTRIHARPTCLLPIESIKKQEIENLETETVNPLLKQPVECSLPAVCLESPVDSGNLASTNCSEASINIEELSVTNLENSRQEVKWESAETSSYVRNCEYEVEVAPELGSANDTIEPSCVSTFSTDNSSAEVDGNNVVASISGIENVSKGNQSNANRGWERVLTDELTTTNYLKIEEGRAASIVFPITASETRETDSCNITCTPKHSECKTGGVFPDNDSKRAAINSNGECCMSKLKPVLAPGFLGKYPQKNGKQKIRVAVEAKNTPQICLNEQVNEVAKSGMVSTDSAANNVLRHGDSEPSNCIHCNYQNSHNSAGGLAAKPCC